MKSISIKVKNFKIIQIINKQILIMYRKIIKKLINLFGFGKLYGI